MGFRMANFSLFKLPVVIFFLHEECSSSCCCGKFNIRSTISYYNVKPIKDNINEVEAKGNYFRLLTLKIVHPNNREFCSYDSAGTLDKQYILAGNHSFVKSGQRIIFF